MQGLQELKTNLTKDFKKYLSVSVQVYVFVLVIIFILKLIGLDYFGLDYEKVSVIDAKINKFPINYIINFIILIIQLYFLTYIVTLKKPKVIELIITTLINVLAGVLIFTLKLNFIYTIVSFLILIIYFKIKGAKLKRILKVLIINTILQIISVVTRNNTIVEYSFSLSLLLDIDYMLMLLIYYKIVKEGINLCQYQIHGLSSLKKINLKTLLTKLRTNYSNFKKQDKRYKASIIIYLILSFIWNMLTLLIIIFVAILNHTIIECIFILTSFWLSKKIFGKEFHLNSMLHCFIVLACYIVS